MLQPFTARPARSSLGFALFIVPLCLALLAGDARADDDEEPPPDDEKASEGSESTVKPSQAAQPATVEKPALEKPAITVKPPILATPDEPWPLARWEAEALRHSPLLTEAAQETALQQARLMEAAWARFPRIDWQSTLVPVPTLKGDVTHTVTQLTNFTGFGGTLQQHRFDVHLPIYSFGRLRAQKRAAAAAKDGALAGERLARAWSRPAALRSA